MEKKFYIANIKTPETFKIIFNLLKNLGVSTIYRQVLDEASFSDFYKFSVVECHPLVIKQVGNIRFLLYSSRYVGEDAFEITDYPVYSAENFIFNCYQEYLPKISIF